MQKLGQHFLKNRSALRLIAESLKLALDETVIEIGPGHGELTEFLRTTNNGSQIVLIEKDEKLFGLLKEKFGGDSRITVIHGDALEILPTIIQNFKFRIFNYKIVGNIPYYITGHLLRILSELEHKPERCLFTLQKEVAERVCAAPPRMNRLAASVQFWASAKIIKIVPASDFSPPPKVSSAIIVLKTTEPADCDAGNYYTAVRALFAQPRKTLVNNLVSATGQKGTIVAEKLSAIGITPIHRPQNLNIDGIVAIAKTFFSID
jgi:16S rRNA (adenine1518-N6/adenine1519-N6)-dimethyltransferase